MVCGCCGVCREGAGAAAGGGLGIELVEETNEEMN